VLRPVKLTGDRRIFVEPEAVASNGSLILVAGQPTYLWSVKASYASLVGRDTVLGVIIDSVANATIIPAPIGAKRVQTVRAVAGGAGRWAVTFAEAEPRAKLGDDPRVVAYWFGITDGTRWLRLEKLPPVDGELQTSSASSLIQTSEGFAIAVPVRRGTAAASAIEIFAEHAGRWTTTEVAPGIVTYASLATDSIGLVLAAVYPDTSLRADHNSLWFYRLPIGARTWGPPVRAIVGEGRPVHHPLLSSVANHTIAVTWQVRIPTKAIETRVGVLGEGMTLRDSSILTRTRELPLPAMRVRDLSILVAERRLQDSTSTLGIWRMSNRGPELMADAPFPFQGVFGAAPIGNTSVGVVGPVMGTPPRDPVVSLYIQRFDLKCW